MDRDRIINKLRSSLLMPEGKRTTFRVDKELGRGGNGAAFVVKPDGKGDELVAKFYVPPDNRDLDDAALKRFQHEVTLVTRMAHPFIVPCEGIGSVSVGAYTVPFYLMPRAQGTMRDMLPQAFTPDTLPERLSVFLRALLGVSYLHALGIVHRDLKPENILMFPGNTPRIADFGIAHVGPVVLKTSQFTLPADRLMNRDYYAPEQRYGDATKVDHRADIYAMGCMLYELISAIPAVRPNLPTLADLDPHLKPFDTVFSRMTTHSPRGRYKHIDIAIDEIVTAMCSVRSISDGVMPNEDLRGELVKCIRSNNPTMRERALELARRLGSGALPQLHEELGHIRLDVALTTYRIVAELRCEESIPWLVAGLYPRRSSQKIRFPTGEVAAKALRGYSVETRMQVLKTLKDVVRPEDVEIIAEGLPWESVFPLLQKLEDKKLMHSDWDSPSPLRVFLKLDENAGWAIVSARLDEGLDISSWRLLRDIYPLVNLDRKRLLIDHLLSKPSSLSYGMSGVLEAIAGTDFPPDHKREAIRRILNISDGVIRKWDELQDFRRQAEAVLKKLDGASTGSETKKAKTGQP